MLGKLRLSLGSLTIFGPWFVRNWPSLLVVILIALPIFGHLDEMPIQIWDESRQAINAYEMAQDGDWIVTHFKGKPDMWNTKPPLLIWLQVIGIKLLGFGELAIRFPSALAAFLTCLVLLVFLRRYLKDQWPGIFAVLALVTAVGYVNIHGSRTGDFDAMLTLFTTGMGLLFFAYFETGNAKYLIWFFVALSLGCLTKSVAPLLFGPGLLIYALIRNKVLAILRSRQFYIGLGIFLITVLGYYALREALNPGFLEAVWENELGGRYNSTLEGHQHPFGYYYDHLRETRFSDFFWLLPVGFLLGFFAKDARKRNMAIFAGLMALTHFLLISSSKTKLGWYDIPEMPFGAIIVALAIYTLWEFLRDWEWAKTHLRYNILPLIVVYLIFQQPYAEVYTRNSRPVYFQANDPYYQMSRLMQAGLKGHFNMHGEVIAGNERYAPHLYFYQLLLKEKGQDVSYALYTDSFPPGTVVNTGLDFVNRYFREHYEHEEVRNFQESFTLRLGERYPGK